MVKKTTREIAAMLRTAESSAYIAYDIASHGKYSDSAADEYNVDLRAHIDVLVDALMAQTDEPIKPHVVYSLVAVRQYFMAITFVEHLVPIYTRAVNPVRAYGHDTEVISAAERSLFEDFEHLEKVLFNRSKYATAYVLYAVLLLAALRLIYLDAQKFLRDAPK